MGAQLPKDSWGYHYSRAHPDVRIELLDRVEVAPDKLLVEVRMIGEAAGAFAEEWERFPMIASVETHLQGERNVLYRIQMVPPSIHTVTVRHRVLTRYPIVIQDGWSRFETFASAPQMRGFLADLRLQVGPGQIESVRRGVAPLERLGLTPTQDSVFREAVSAGYYAVPREISLSALASRVGRSKSTVSVTLMKIEKALADSAIQLDLTSFRLSA